MKVRQIIAVFERCFTEQYATRLCGGAEEPLYLPKQGATLARLHFRADYAASALHEVAHWCLAGTERRRCVDFGYEYIAPPRTAVQQQYFYAAELRAQSLEQCLAEAAGVQFSISTDNIAANGVINANARLQAQAFATQLQQQRATTIAWLASSAGTRASKFIDELRRARGKS